MKTFLKFIVFNIAIFNFSICNLFAQDIRHDINADIAKKQQEQIGFVENKTTNYKQTTHKDAQWFGTAGFGMFIHWNIASVREIDLSWPMMSGTQIGWSSNKPSQDSINRFVANGNFWAGHKCSKNNSCLTPVEYWSMAKYFNPQSYNPEEWAKAAKAAGMTYMVLTTRHHDGFAMWPSNYGDFNTKKFMGGRDLVKPYVEACRKYGLKVGLYYSGPDWYFNRNVQSFLYYGLQKNYKNVHSLDENLKPRTTTKSQTELQIHYDSVAVYLKGQITELLTNYGKIDMIWFDGSADIPKGNPAWQKCISMDDIHKLQPGIVVSPRFFGYGDYKTFESDRELPKTKQTGWAEFCTTIAVTGWGYTNSPLKPINKVLNDLILCRSRNSNELLNFGPDKNGVFSDEMKSDLQMLADWMKVNGVSLKNSTALPENESASIPATSNKSHRYFFLFTDNKSNEIQFITPLKVKNVKLLTNGKKMKYETSNDKVTISVADINSKNLAQVIDVELIK